MELSERLSALRRQAVGDDADPRKVAASLAARVNRLSTGRRAGAQPSQRPGDEQSLAEAVSGRPIAPGVVLIEQRMPWEGRHGRQPLGGILRRLSNLPRPPVWPEVPGPTCFSWGLPACTGGCWWFVNIC